MPSRQTAATRLLAAVRTGWRVWQAEQLAPSQLFDSSRRFADDIGVAPYDVFEASGRRRTFRPDRGSGGS